MAVDKVFYNQSSQVKLGWEPDWWGCEYNDEELVEAVRKWQRRINITADGLVGPTTYRRIWTEREADIHDYAPPPSRQCGVGQKFIVHNSKFLPIEWDKVVLWDEEDGLKCNKGNYYDYSGKPDRKPNHFTNHWDVCLSTETMAKVINRRGVSMHFGIDNDGTIYQLMDTQNGAWQAGHWYGNKQGIGVEISNAYYPKYQGWYEKNGFGPRPLVEGATVHGKTLGDHLGFYPVQLEALKKLWKALHLGIGIPLEYPAERDGSLCNTVHPDVTGGRFEGFCNHYNYTRNKIDCAELDLVKLLKEVKDEL